MPFCKKLLSVKYITKLLYPHPSKNKTPSLTPLVFLSRWISSKKCPNFCVPRLLIPEGSYWVVNLSACMMLSRSHNFLKVLKVQVGPVRHWSVIKLGRDEKIFAKSKKSEWWEIGMKENVFLSQPSLLTSVECAPRKLVLGFRLTHHCWLVEISFIRVL